MNRFPTNPSLRSSWLKACGFLDSDHGPNRKLCSKHFEEDCFNGTIKRYLKPKSIPTLHLKCRKTYVQHTRIFVSRSLLILNLDDKYFILSIRH